MTQPRCQLLVPGMVILKLSNIHLRADYCQGDGYFIMTREDATASHVHLQSTRTEHAQVRRHTDHTPHRGKEGVTTQTAGFKVHPPWCFSTAG